MLQEMSNEEYHSRPELSQSTAKKLGDSSPQHVRHELDNPPAVRPTYFDVGSMTHTAVLQPGQLDEEYDYIPDEFDGYGPRTKVYKEALRSLQAERPEVTFLKKSDYDLCLDLAGAVLANPVVAGYLAEDGALVEQSGFFSYSGCPCRIRPDLLLPEQGIVMDLKTTSGSASRRGFTSSVRKFGYDFQNCFYREGLRVLGYPVKKFVFAVIEKTPPHALGLYVISGSDVNAQLGRMRDACNLWSYCTETGFWPGYPEHLISIDLKPKASNRRISMADITRQHGVSKYRMNRLAAAYDLDGRRVGNKKTFDEGDVLNALRLHESGMPKPKKPKPKAKNNNAKATVTVTPGASTEAGKGDDETNGSS